jgi:hypothetical protein
MKSSNERKVIVNQFDNQLMKLDLSSAEAITIVGELLAHVLVRASFNQRKDPIWDQDEAKQATKLFLEKLHSEVWKVLDEQKKTC